MPSFPDDAPISFGQVGGSPDSDYKSPIDLNQALVPNPAYTYFLRVQGNDMEACGIEHGAVIMVDRSHAPQPCAIVVAVIDGELKIRRLTEREGVMYLTHGDGACSTPLKNDAQIWGVVTYSIHSHLPAKAK